MQGLEEQIEYLENKLLHTDVRKNPELLTSLLAEDFEEIGSSGIVNTRAEVVEWLTRKEQDITWTLSHFRVKLLSENIVLANYQAIKNGTTSSKGSIRSSIWQRNNGNWQMIFHQATKL